MQLEMLLSERTPARPYTSTDPKQHGIWHASRKRALNAPYIQVNPPKLKYWMVFDVDRNGAGLAWEDAHLPAPAWAAINKENGHAHLAWGLSVPVSSGDASRDAPLRYLCALEAAYRDKLRADVGYSGVITKNPLHPLWRTLRGTDHLYEMAELAEYVDLERFRLKRGKQPEPVGLGRNCILFDYLRTWAYTAVRRHHRHGGQRLHRLAQQEGRARRQQGSEANAMLRCDKQRNGEWEGMLGFWFHPESMQYLERIDGVPMRYSLN